MQNSTYFKKNDLQFDSNFKGAIKAFSSSPNQSHFSQDVNKSNLCHEISMIAYQVVLDFSAKSFRRF